MELTVQVIISTWQSGKIGRIAGNFDLNRRYDTFD